MAMRPPIDSLVKSLTIVSSIVCMLGAIGGMAVVLIRVPAIANSRLELLFGTLQGVAVTLLFAIAALLINLTFMVRRASRSITEPRGRELSQS